MSVVIVTSGVVLVTLSRSPTSNDSGKPILISSEDARKYFLGIIMMTVSLICTGVLGIMQERTYKIYGPCWREGLFYTVCNELKSIALYLCFDLCLAFPFSSCLPLPG